MESFLGCKHESLLGDEKSSMGKLWEICWCQKSRLVSLKLKHFSEWWLLELTREKLNLKSPFSISPSLLLVLLTNLQLLTGYYIYYFLSSCAERKGRTFFAISSTKTHKFFFFFARQIKFVGLFSDDYTWKMDHLIEYANIIHRSSREGKRFERKKTSSFPIYMGCFNHTMHHQNLRQGWQIFRRTFAQRANALIMKWKQINFYGNMFAKLGGKFHPAMFCQPRMAMMFKGRRCVMEMIRALWREFHFSIK